MDFMMIMNYRWLSLFVSLLNLVEAIYFECEALQSDFLSVTA